MTAVVPSEGALSDLHVQCAPHFVCSRSTEGALSHLCSMRAPLVIAVFPLKVFSQCLTSAVRPLCDCSRSTEGALSDLSVQCASLL